ncbi:galactose-proton symport [Saitoella complicata NRRL Y-17804]|nr:galactose-proton symport [Saitoella complicata NRRL Y-17804]ODQ52315.1 galactose-proton symport [Saitoella complicata NRRL Y-17804]
MAPRNHVASHPDLFKVNFQDGSFASELLAVKDFKKGDVIASLEGLTPGPKRYTSVQVSRDSHIELNSDLVYMNHSCAPTAIVDIKNRVVRAVEDIPTGSPITFFYPSTEWDMDQPFDCNCHAKRCLGEIRGARYIPKEKAQAYWFNEHIEELQREEGLVN